MTGLLREFLIWIDGLGAWGPFFFIASYIVSLLLLIPSTFLTLGAGVLYGVAWGTVYVSIASTVGATCAFLLARYQVRGFVERKIRGNPKFRAIDEAVAREGWKIVGLTRLSVLLPFVYLNYAFGVTKVKLKDYFWATWFGMIPGTALYVYIGSLAGDITQLSARPRARTPLEWIGYGAGFLMTAVVTVYVARVARKALEKYA